MPQEELMTKTTLELRLFESGDARAFHDLNVAWIAKFFVVEEHDEEMLSDPGGYILAQGGQIVMAFEDGRAVGCCALILMEPGVYEVAKMAVAEDCQGRGVGRKVLARVVEQARAMGAKRLYLETSHHLKNAIHLYEALGFRHLPPQETPYARADVFMEMWLEADRG